MKSASIHKRGVGPSGLKAEPKRQPVSERDMFSIEEKDNLIRMVEQEPCLWITPRDDEAPLEQRDYWKRLARNLVTIFNYTTPKNWVDCSKAWRVLYMKYSDLVFRFRVRFGKFPSVLDTPVEREFFTWHFASSMSFLLPQLIEDVENYPQFLKDELESQAKSDAGIKEEPQDERPVQHPFPHASTIGSPYMMAQVKEEISESQGPLEKKAKLAVKSQIPSCKNTTPRDASADMADLATCSTTEALEALVKRELSCREGTTPQNSDNLKRCRSPITLPLNCTKFKPRDTVFGITTSASRCRRTSSTADSFHRLLINAVCPRRRLWDKFLDTKSSDWEDVAKEVSNAMHCIVTAGECQTDFFELVREVNEMERSSGELTDNQKSWIWDAMSFYRDMEGRWNAFGRMPKQEEFILREEDSALTLEMANARKRGHTDSVVEHVRHAPLPRISRLSLGEMVDQTLQAMSANEYLIAEDFKYDVKVLVEKYHKKIKRSRSSVRT